MKKIISLLLAVCCCVGAMAVKVPNDEIWYEASAKLSETTSSSESGLHTKAFNTSIQSHTFSNGKGVIKFNNTITYIGEFAFYCCSGLTSIEIPNSVTGINNWAFSGCYIESSKFINNSRLDAESNKYWGAKICDVRTDDGVCIKDGVLLYCVGGSVCITIPNSVTSIGENAFSGCSGLTSIEIPNSVTNIEKWAFSGCSSLTSIEIPNSVTSIGEYAFSGCYIESSKFINNSRLDAESNKYWGAKICDVRTDDGFCIKDGVLLYFVGGSVCITIPNSVTSIGEYAFQYCSGLTSIEIPNSVTSIGEYAFQYCSGLTSIEIPNSVTSIGEYAFSGCSSLTSIEIPNSVTSIGDGAFEDCSSISSIIVDSENKYYDSRNNCNAIIESKSNTLLVGCKNTIIPNSMTAIAANAFRNCYGLTSIEIPSSVASIGVGAFHGCYNLVSVNIPNSVTCIGNGTFYECRALTSLTLPNGLTTIGLYAFYDCSNLTTLTIPNSVTSIGQEAFLGCSSLQAIYVNWDSPLIIPTNYFRYIDKNKCVLYVPRGTAYKYCNAEEWSTFSHIVEYDSSESEEEKLLRECDTNGDGKVNATDIMKIYNYILSH